jgi:hypothetical protein
MDINRMKTSSPAGLSRRSVRIWRELTERHHFERHELIAFERALRWWDQADLWLLASKTATGRAQASLIKQSMDASTAGLRFWRTLKFVDLDNPARRPGRPSGEAWSAQRRVMGKVG